MATRHFPKSTVSNDCPHLCTGDPRTDEIGLRLHRRQAAGVPMPLRVLFLPGKCHLLTAEGHRSGWDDVMAGAFLSGGSRRVRSDRCWRREAEREGGTPPRGVPWSSGSHSPSRAIPCPPGCCPRGRGSRSQCQCPSEPAHYRRSAECADAHRFRPQTFTCLLKCVRTQLCHCEGRISEQNR